VSSQDLELFRTTNGTYPRTLKEVQRLAIESKQLKLDNLQLQQGHQPALDRLKHELERQQQENQRQSVKIKSQQQDNQRQSEEIERQKQDNQRQSEEIERLKK